MTRPFRAAFIAMITAVCVVLFAGYVFGQDPLRDPFEAYSAVMPDNPRPTDGDWRCETEFTQPQPGGYFYCFLLVRQPVLRWVSISGANAVISRAGFGVNLRYGDLIALYGRPRSIAGNGYVRIARWSGIQAYLKPGRDGVLNMTDPVLYVSFFVELERNR